MLQIYKPKLDTFIINFLLLQKLLCQEGVFLSNKTVHSIVTAMKLSKFPPRCMPDCIQAQGHFTFEVADEFVAGKSAKTSF